MFLTIAAVVLLGAPAVDDDLMSPGAGLGLSPNPIVRPVGVSTQPAPPLLPATIPFAGALATLAGAAAMYRSRRDESPLLVLVHGHGGGAENFDELVRKMDIKGARVVAFDYSWVDGGDDSTASSRSVTTDDAAAALDAYIRQLSVKNSNIYSLHHSKGGAVGVSMIASLDSGSQPPIDGYRGAALLDPAIASGALGIMQSVGHGHDWLPDDGGFDPIQCDDNGCVDVREHLGEASGVDVVAIRNRDALVTNFADKPSGLRVFNLRDGLPSALLYGAFFLPRIFQAHNSVLAHDDVANCVRSEIALPGSCAWGAKPPRRLFRSSGSGSSKYVL